MNRFMIIILLSGIACSFGSSVLFDLSTRTNLTDAGDDSQALRDAIADAVKRSKQHRARRHRKDED